MTTNDDYIRCNKGEDKPGTKAKNMSPIVDRRVLTSVNVNNIYRLQALVIVFAYQPSLSRKRKKQIKQRI